MAAARFPSVQPITVRDIAKRIRRDDEDLDVVVNRLRNWTKEGLLEFVGDKHPGTGKTRLYEPAAIIDALVLTAFADVGLAAVRAGHFGDADGRTILALGRHGACEILDPSREIEQAYLVISGSCDRSRSPTALLRFKTIATAPLAPWAIVVDLNQYLLSLRGIVSAVKKRGVPNIDLIAKEA